MLFIKKNKPLLLKLLVVIVVLLSVIFISFSIHENYFSVIQYHLNVRLNQWVLASITVLGVMYSNALIHLNLLDQALVEKYKVRGIVFSYGLSQVVRYIPGKFAGVALQSLHLTGKLLTASIWKANIIQFFITNVNSLMVLIVSALFFYNQKNALVFLIVPLMVLMYWLIRLNSLEKIFRLLISLSKYGKNINIEPPTNKRTLFVLIFLNIEWLLFFLLCFLIGPVYFSFEKIILLGVVYSAASLLGTLVIFLPSGIFAREAAFVWLGGVAQLPVDVLLVYSIVFRLIFTVGDILFFLICYCYLNIVKRFSKA